MPRDKLIQVRQGDSTTWSSVNPILASGEIGFETNTGKIKIGNGATAWNSLGYLTDLVPTGSGVTLEQVQDNLGNAFIQAGQNVTVVYDDTANILTIAAPIAGILEQVQDNLANSFFQEGDNITLTYDDATNRMVITSTGGGTGEPTGNIDGGTPASIFSMNIDGGSPSTVFP